MPWHFSAFSSFTCTTWFHRQIVTARRKSQNKEIGPCPEGSASQQSPCGSLQKNLVFPLIWKISLPTADCPPLPFCRESLAYVRVCPWADIIFLLLIAQRAGLLIFGYSTADQSELWEPRFCYLWAKREQVTLEFTLWNLNEKCRIDTNCSLKPRVENVQPQAV